MRLDGRIVTVEATAGVLFVPAAEEYPDGEGDESDGRDAAYHAAYDGADGGGGGGVGVGGLGGGGLGWGIWFRVDGWLVRGNVGRVGWGSCRWGWGRYVLVVGLAVTKNSLSSSEDHSTLSKELCFVSHKTWHIISQV